MPRLVFVESSCLVDTWSMATRLVRAALRGSGRADAAIGTLEAEAARGTDPASVHRALWGLLDGHEYRILTALTAVTTPSCAERTDALGAAALRALRWHRRAGDRIVVVTALMPVFAGPLGRHLRVDRVLCGPAPVDASGRLTSGYPDILLGDAAAHAVEGEARGQYVPLADCVAYGRGYCDRELLRVVGQAVRIGYDGELRSLSPCRVPVSAQAMEHSGTSELPVVAKRPLREPAELAAG